MTETIVDLIFRDNQVLVEYLTDAGEVSMSTSVDAYFRKILILSAASYFEHKVTTMLLEFVSERTGADTAILSLVRRKAIERQYHSYFRWDSANANQFFSMFGEEFKEYMARCVDQDQSLDKAIRAFLELGKLRNELVHLNFASFPLDKTVEEIYELYSDANRFVECLPEKLRVPKEVN